MTYCIKCSKLLTNDDIGFHRKMVNRGAKECMCIECLCDYFGISVERAHEMIERSVSRAAHYLNRRGSAAVK